MLEQAVFEELPITRGFSEQALNDLANVLDGASAQSQARFVRALCYGITSHKDALGYDLVQAKAFITKVEQSAGQRLDCSGFPLLTLEPSELASALRAVEGVTYHKGLLGFAGSTIHSKHLLLYAQLENFLLSMEDFSFAQEWTELSDQIRSQPSNDTVLKRIAQTVSRRMYQYRKIHFGLYYAYRQYTDIAAFAADHHINAAELQDEQILAFWLSEPHHFLSFNALLRAVKSFRQYQERGRQVELNALDQGDKPLAEDEFGGPIDTDTLDAQLAELRATLLPLVAKGDLDAFSGWLEHYDVKRDLSKSIVRALSYAPVTNVLAQLKRQCASENKKAECANAQLAIPYTSLIAELDALSVKFRDACIEVASILQHPDLEANIVDFRAAKRKKSRARGYKRPEIEIRADAENITDAVASMNFCAQAMSDAQKALGFPEQKMEEAFRSDRVNFSTVFRRVHLEADPK